MPATTLRLFRKVHLYFGLFISPALLFFAFTGAVQTLSLHEAAGSSYKPPALPAELGQLHKKQTTEMPVRKAAGPEPGHAPGGVDRAGAVTAVPRPAVTLAGKQRQHLAMKVFFLAVALGLVSSTATGIYMVYKYERNRLAATATLVAGAVLPMVLVKL